MAIFHERVALAACFSGLFLLGSVVSFKGKHDDFRISSITETKNIKQVSCNFDQLKGRYSSLQVAWLLFWTWTFSLPLRPTLRYGGHFWGLFFQRVWLTRASDPPLFLLRC